MQKTLGIGGLVAALALACAPRADAPHRERFLKYRDAHLPQPDAPAGAHLDYWGGHVIANAKVFLVLWGNNVRADTAANMPGFFQAVTNSPYLDFLDEYDTNITAQGGSAGTQQFVGRGTFAGSITLTPSASGNQLSDSQISSELDAQINSGALPAPDADTLYMTYFPPGVSISSGSGQSCSPGGFCAYHGTFLRGGQSVFYGVMPDNSPGSGCDTGCGSGTAFENLCVVSSHELGEAITDAEVGLATVTGPPLAWYDSANGELGDICAGTTTGLPGAASTYSVQKLWSNAATGCVATRTSSADFSVSLSPLSVQLPAGTSTSVTVQTQSTAGAPGSIALTLGALPTGVTGALSPASVSAGQNSTLTLTADASAAPINYVPVAVVANAATAHSASLILQVKPPPPNDFAVGLTPAQITFTPGSQAQLTASTSIVRGAPTSIAVSVSGLPSTVTAQVAPASLNGGQSALIVLSSTTATATGTYPFIVTAQTSQVMHQAAGTLTVVAGPPQPWVEITAPAPSSTVTGSILVSVQAGNVSSGANLELSLDGAAFATGSGSTLSQSWDSSQVQNGPHTLLAKVTDGTQSATATVSVTTQNALSVAITAPARGATVSGTATVTAAATLVSGATLSRIELYVDGTLAGNSATSPLTASVDTTRLADGPHALTAKAYDAASDTATAVPVQVLVQNGSSGESGPTVNGGCGCGASPGELPLAFLLAAVGLRSRRRGAGSRRW